MCGVVLGEMDIFDPFRRLRKAEGKIWRHFDDMPQSEGLREPLIDVLDRGKELRVIVELPGVEKRDIELSVDAQSFIIKAKSEFEVKKGKKEKGHYYHKHCLQNFFRSIPLPVEIVPEKAAAEFRNGVLSITLPIKHPKEMRKGRKIEIK